MAQLVMEHALAQFIAANERKPWLPCSVDCCMALASWAMWLGHSDPAEHLRGTYHDDAGFHSIIDRAGSAVAVVSACVLKINGKRVQRPFCGAVGVIGSERNIHRQWGAIFDGERWLVRGRDGFHPMTAKNLAIWII